MQVPVPPAPPAPPEIPDLSHLPAILDGGDITRIVVFSMAGLAVMVWLVVRGPIGQAIGEGLKRLFGVRAGGGVLPGELDALRSEVEAMRVQLDELAERQEFAERMLAQVRRELRLPGAADVAR